MKNRTPPAVVAPVQVGPGEGWCRTCGSPVTVHHACACWCMIADALQRYLGMDYDGAAQEAAGQWAAAPPEDMERVWTAAYAAGHFQHGPDGEQLPIPVYPPPPEHAALCEQDHRDNPHAEPCPRCGRRRWDENNPAGGPYRCDACGWVTWLTLAA